MISAERFLTLLEEKDLLPPGVMAKLRLQVANAKKAPTASGVAKALIDKGYLTPVLAKRLLDSEPEGGAKDSPWAVDAVAVAPIEEESALGLVPVESDEPPARKPTAKAPQTVGREPPANQVHVARFAEIVAEAAPAALVEDDLVPLNVGEAVLAAPVAPMAGILSGSAMDLTSADAGMDGAIPSSGEKKSIFSFFRRNKKPTKREDWGSVFMLVGGGALLLLIGVIVLVVWSINRQGLEQKYTQAQDFYKNQSYEQAIKTYDEFAKTFPNHKEASSARVWKGMAQLRQVMQGGDWSECLKTAKTVLEQITNEPNIGDANKELADVLPQIAEGLAKKAKENSSPELVAQTREILVLINQHVPGSLSVPTKIADIEASLSLTVRQIDRNKELEKAIADLKETVKQQKTTESYAIRRALLKKYPDLIDDAKLAAMSAEISQAQQAAVKAVAETKAAAKDESPTTLAAAVTLAQRNTKTSLDDVQGRIVCVSAEGAAYGLDASTGKVLWRRFVGYPLSGQSIAPPPVPASSEAGADVLAVDTAQNDILRLDSATGKLQWRCSLGEPFVPPPVLAGNRLLAASPSGKLFALDAETGDSTGYAQLPQPLRVPPTVDIARSLVFQIAEHSNLYVMGLDDLSCKQVYLLGHEAGSITSAPTIVSGYLVLGINEGAQDSSLRLFAVDRGKADKPGITIKQTQQIALKGRIDITPAVDGNRVLVATDRGVVRVFDLTPTPDKGTQLRDVAETAIEGGDNVARFALLQGGQFWVADIQLTKFDVVGSKGRLVPKWIVDEQCAFLQPPVAAGTSVIAVRRKANQPGVFVSAVNVEEPTRCWETILAVPPAGELIVDGQNRNITAFTKLGGMFQLDEGNLKDQTVVDAPAVSIDPARLQQPIGSVTLLEKGIIALSARQGATQINVFDPADGQKRYRWVALSEMSACPPVELGDGLLIPSRGGAVFLLDPLSGKPLAAPFQSPLETGVQPVWQKPAVCGKQEFVIADGRNKVYRLGRVDAPKPHLAVLDQVDVPQSQESPAAVIGNTAFIADAEDTLGIFELPKLKRVKEHKLTGRCAWGPAVLNDRVLLATDDNQLLCLDSKGEKLWQTALAYGPLSGSPLPVENGYILASTGGVIWRVDAGGGKELGKIETGRALATGPAAMGTQLFVGGADGCIYEVKLP